MKKIASLFIAFSLVFSTVGTSLLFNDEPTIAQAKKYSSGKKSFNPKQNNNFQNKSKDTTQFKSEPKQKNSQKQTSTQKSSKGGLMKGLLFGGIAGLLFGSLLSNLGVLGSFLGLVINLFAIYIVLSFIIRNFQKRKEDKEQWNN